MNTPSLWKYKVTSGGENAIAQLWFCWDTLSDFPHLIKSAMEYEMYVSGSVGAWLFAWSVFRPCRVSCCLSEVLVEKHWHKHKKKSASPFCRPFPSFFPCSVKLLNKQHSEKTLLGEQFRENSVTFSKSDAQCAGLASHCCLTWKGKWCCLDTRIWLLIVAGGCPLSQRLTGLAWEIRQHHGKC